MSARVTAVLLAICAVATPASPVVAIARAETRPPKAVFIVGPTNGLTDSNLADATEMAEQATAEGMDVRRVFFPYATWDNVLANIQGASLVVYMGHGYGWPSPYTSKMTESRQNGFGLNSYAGSGRSEYSYFGAKPIRETIVLAPNSVVILVHGCYTAGNGEPGMAIPSEELAIERVDNYANGFLAAGARAVFAFGWNQRLDFPHALASSDATMDDLFMTSAGGSPQGFIGWRDQRHPSLRSAGATIHLDPHPTAGYYRALTGDLDMTATEWRAGAAQTDPGSPPTAEPPQITELAAGSNLTSIPGATATADVASFHPNGDGLDDELFLRHTVTRATFLDVTVADSSGEPVRSYTAWSAAGPGTSRWDGRDDTGNVVADGQYTLSYVPRDASGLTGGAVSVNAMVLTAIAVAVPSKAAIYVGDGDALARSTKLAVDLNQPAQLSWQIVDESGELVRSISDDRLTPTGTQSFTWDGRDDRGTWVADGVYRSIVSAQTGLGAYAQERSVYVGAFRITPSTVGPRRGERVTLNLVSTENLGSNPRVLVTQSGLDPWSVPAKHLSGRRYRVSLTLGTGGTGESVQFVVSGVDAAGGRQSSALMLPLQ